MPKTWRNSTLSNMHMKVRPTPKAIIRHYWAHLSSVWNGTLWEKTLIYRTWGSLSLLLRVISANQFRQSEPAKVEHVLVLDTGRPTVVKGPNITHGCILWCERVLQPRGVTVINNLGELGEKIEDLGEAILVISHDYLFELAHKRNYSEIFRILSAARKRKLRIWAFLADLYWLRMTLMSSILVAGTGGLHPMLTNSTPEARRYGLPRPVGPLFWTLPQLHREDCSLPDWESKHQLALGSASGDPRRKDIISQVLPSLQAQGFLFRWSNSLEIPYSTYLSLLSQSKLALVPTLLQEEFQKGHLRYRKRLSKTIVTGRVFETFAAKTALVTNFNRNLEDWGFSAGTHYLIMPEGERDIERWKCPPDEELRAIAFRAHSHWRYLWANQQEVLSQQNSYLKRNRLTR